MVLSKNYFEKMQYRYISTTMVLSKKYFEKMQYRYISSTFSTVVISSSRGVPVTPAKFKKNVPNRIKHKTSGIR